MSRRARTGLFTATLASALALATACGRDEADRAYLEALTREKTGAPAAELLPLIDRAIFLAPERAAYWEKRGAYRAAIGYLADAEADLDQAIRLADRPYLRFSRGLVRCRAGRCAEAVADLDVAIAAQPGNSPFYRGRALARAAAGDANGALADAELLVARVPQDGESFYARGVAHAALGRCADALADFDTTLRMRPELVYPLEAHAACLETLGRDDEATAVLTQIVARSIGQRPGEGCGTCFDPFHF